MLEVRDLHTYHGSVPALRGVSFQVEPGQLLAIIGANGAGKSTLLGTIAGLYAPRSGQVSLGGADLTRRPPEHVVRAGLALVPERRQIFDTLTVRENLVLGAYHRYRRDRDRLPADLDRVLDIFPRLRERMWQLGGTLSGGEQQMLAIGRGLMAAPRVLLLDEPSLGLAPMVVREIMRVLRSLRDEAGVTVVLVEQNARAAFRVADTVHVLERGRVVAAGTPAQLLTDPRLEAAYLGKGYQAVGE